jgi:hypothetical protein
MTDFSTDIGTIPETQANENIAETLTPVKTPSPLSVIGDAAAPIAAGIDKENLTSKEQSLSDAYAQITKLRKASAQGRITFQDARTRVVALLKENINAMPYHANELRQHAAGFFGAYGEGWGVLNQMQDEKTAMANQNSLDMHYMKMIQTETGMRYNPTDVGGHKEVAYRKEIDNQAKAAENLQKMHAITKDNGMDLVSAMLLPLRTQLADRISLKFNTFMVGNKSIGDMVATGASSNDIIEALGKDDTARKDLETQLRTELDMSVQAAGQAFDAKIATLARDGVMYDFQTVAAQRKAYLEPLTSVKESLARDDANGLTRYVALLQNKNKARNEAVMDANPAMAFMKQTGMFNDGTWQLFLTNPDAIPSNIRPYFQDVVNQRKSIEQLDKLIKHVATNPQDMMNIEKYDEKTKTVIEYTALKDMEKIIRSGKFDNDSQKQWFFAASYIYLNGVNSNQKGHLDDMIKKFEDERYTKLFASLPNEQQSKLSELMFTKLQREMFTPVGPVPAIVESVKAASDAARLQKVALYYDEQSQKIQAKSVLEASNESGDMAGIVQQPVDFMPAEIDRLNKYIDLLEATYPMKARSSTLRPRIVKQVLDAIGVAGNTDWTPEMGLNKLQTATPLQEK